MSDLLPITPEEMRAEVRREIKERHRVYDRLVGNKKLRKEVADRRIAIMEEVLLAMDGKSTILRIGT